MPMVDTILYAHNSGSAALKANFQKTYPNDGFVFFVKLYSWLQAGCSKE